MRIPSITILALAATALAVGSATASAKSSGFFKTPNGKIYCEWAGSNVVCGIKNRRLKPAPKNNCKGIDYIGGWLAVNGRGSSRIQACSGDAGPFANPSRTSTLKSGATKRLGSTSCKGTSSAMTCRNASKHGFTINTSGTYKRF